MNKGEERRGKCRWFLIWSVIFLFSIYGTICSKKFSCPEEQKISIDDWGMRDNGGGWPFDGNERQKGLAGKKYIESVSLDEDKKESHLSYNVSISWIRTLRKKRGHVKFSLEAEIRRQFDGCEYGVKNLMEVLNDIGQLDGADIRNALQSPPEVVLNRMMALDVLMKSSEMTDLFSVGREAKAELMGFARASLPVRANLSTKKVLLAEKIEAFETLSRLLPVDDFIDLASKVDVRVSRFFFLTFFDDLGRLLGFDMQRGCLV